MRRASLRNNFPASLIFTPRGRRSKSRKPISSSKSWIWRESAGWATRRRLAARPSCCSSPTATKYLRCRSSIPIPCRYQFDSKDVLDASLNDLATCLCKHMAARSCISSDMKAPVVNALGSGSELEDIDIATPFGREVLIDVQASGLCHTDLLFATHDIVPIPAMLGHEVSGIVAGVGPDVTQFR